MICFSSPLLPSLFFASFVLLLTQLGCRADTFDCPNSEKPNSDELQLLFAKRMKKMLYHVGGVFYDQKQRLTVSIASNGIELDDGFEKVNATAFKEAALDIYGPSVLLSQINPKKAEKLMGEAENKANRKAKKKGKRPPSSAIIDANIRSAILGDEKLLNKIKITFTPAKFTFEDLYYDYERLVSSLLKSSRGWEYMDSINNDEGKKASFKKYIHIMDLDEENNRIYISVFNEEGLKYVEEVAQTLEIDTKKIYTKIQPKGESYLDQGPSLQDYNRPIRGGLYIAVPIPSSPWRRGCSIGFVAKRGQTGEVGFVTNSHCTQITASVDAMKAYQVQIGSLSIPPSPADGDDVIGIETSDAILQPDGSICSDSAFFTFENGVSYDTSINKAQQNGSNLLKTSGLKTWYSLRINTNSLANEVVYKVGRNTGQTRGKVKQTCVFVAESNAWDEDRTCQDIVNNYDTDIRFQWKGDSGSATFFTLNANSRFAWIRGSSWGRTANHDNCLLPNYADCPNVVDEIDHPVYIWDHYVSPISNVECDHGELFVHYNDIP